MEILRRYYPHEEHVFVFDNASTHMKRAPTAISALKMTRHPSKTFGVDVNVIGSNGRPIYGPDGKYSKQRVRMSSGAYADGSIQEFYFPNDHAQYPGWFKGMQWILEDRGISTKKWKAQCGTNFFRLPRGSNSLLLPPCTL